MMRQPTGGGSPIGRLVAGETRSAAHLQNEVSNGTLQQETAEGLPSLALRYKKWTTLNTW